MPGLAACRAVLESLWALRGVSFPCWTVGEDGIAFAMDIWGEPREAVLARLHATHEAMERAHRFQRRRH
jgi:hypothetical protein